VVIVLALDPRFAGSNPAKDDGCLRAIVFRSKTSFVQKVKPSLQYLKILRHVKETYGYERDASSAKFTTFVLFFATRCLCWILLESCG
jgi:hypothetical protein